MSTFPCFGRLRTLGLASLALLFGNAVFANGTQYTLTITGSPSAGGTFTGAGTYASGTRVTIQETASDGYSTAGWGGASVGSVASPSSASTTIVMSANRTLVANFTANVPVFTSSAANQALSVGHSYSFQVSATQSPVFSATGLPPGLTISSMGSINGTPTAAGTYSATVTASNNAVSVEEVSVGAGETAYISSTNIGNDVDVYATDLNLQVNGASTVGFCIDPWDASVEGQPLAYNWEALAAGPKVADGMGVTAALEIGQLWDQYYTPSISNSTAAGLQIAIWEIVAASINAQNLGTYSFSLDSSNNYGAASMIAWVDANPNAPAAALDALTGSGQDYVTTATSVPQSSIATATQVIPFTVYAQPAVGSNTASIPVNQPYTYTISATNSPTSYAAGSLAPGLSVNTATGVISGTPTTAGTYGTSLSATNPAGSGSGTLTLTVVPTYTLTINGSPSAGGSTSGAGTYTAGTVVTISETAGSGYRTSGWTGPDSGSVASKSSSTTTIVMSANRSLTANFVQQYTLAVTAGTGGTATGSGTYDAGSTVPITQTANAGYRTNGWTGSGSGTITSPSSASTTVVMNGNENVNASFVQQVTLTVVGGTGGTVTGGGTFDLGASAPITETATTGYRTNGWTGTGTGTVTSPSSASTTVVMSGNETVDASFVQRVTLTVTAGAGGTATGSGTYDVGSIVPIAETANTGYRTNGWTGSGVSNVASPSSASTSIVMSANESVNASFVQQVTLTVVGETGGTVTGGGTFDVGSTAPITETASAGYRTNGWTGSGTGTINSPSSASTTVVMNGNETVDASFIQQVTLTVLAGSGGTATGGGTFDLNSTVSITGSPSTGYGFSDWTGTGPASPASAITTVTLAGNDTVTANFAPLPPTVVLTAAATAYTGSPFHVTSGAAAPADDLTLHSIEWLSPAGVWTVDSVVASGATDNMATGISFSTIGVWTLRAGASIDGGVTWVYSPNAQVTVTSGITNYTLETMAVPSASSLLWYSTSTVSQKTYQVQHVNP